MILIQHIGQPVLLIIRNSYVNIDETYANLEVGKFWNRVVCPSQQ